MTAQMRSAVLNMETYASEIRSGSRAILARGITLIESTRPDHQKLAHELLVRLLPDSGKSHRVGISGVPGAGKSTFIDAMGIRLTAAGHRVAVLAVDPSSARYGGSILGDKTRMARLANDPAAYIRPSPTSGSPGGVTRSTREAIVLVEAAGFDIVIVETVGVGQSETAVADMVDTFLLLTLARTGDNLQGIKRGVFELVDVVAVNKADGSHVTESKRTARELADALSLFEPQDPDWKPPVLTCSAQEGTGIDEVLRQIERHKAHLADTSRFAGKRVQQETQWMLAMVRERLLGRLRSDPNIRRRIQSLQNEMSRGAITATSAAEELLVDLQRPPVTYHE
jgi:LAO/AO transport system kinase